MLAPSCSFGVAIRIPRTDRIRSIEVYRPAIVNGLYRVTEVISRSEDHDVVAGVEVRGDREVVLKRVRQPGRNLVRRLSSLDHALRQLDHRGVVRVVEYKETRANAWLVTERVQGRRLLDWWQRLPLRPAARFEDRWRHVAPLLSGLLDALEALHSVNIAHLDLKPANIRVDAVGVPTLVDFGLPELTSAPTPVEGDPDGCVGFKAPELLEALSVSRRADQFSLGLVLYLLLTGRRALAGLTPEELAHAYDVGRVQPLREWRPETPVDVEEVVLRMLDWDPEKRFPSIGALREALGNRLKPAPPQVLQPWAVRPPELVGREPFGAVFRKRLLELKQGRSSVVKMVAVAGAGKTRLLDAWAEQAGDEGCAVYRANCQPAAPRAVLQGWFRPPPCDPSRPPPDDLVDLALERLAGPTVLLLDDLEELDSIGWARVLRVVKAAAEGRHALLVVLAGRHLPDTSAMVPDDHPRVFGLSLPPLDAASVARLLRPESSDPEDLEVRDAAAENLTAESRGNPGQLTLLLLREERGGRLRRDRGRWVPVMGGDEPRPSHQPPLAPHVLAWMKGLGEPIEVQRLLTCLPLQTSGVLESLTWGSDEGLLTFRVRGGAWCVSGGAAAASSRTELYSVRETHGRAAAWLTNNDQVEGLASERIAEHCRQAGELRDAAEAYEDAAKAMAAVGANSDSRRLLSLSATFRRTRR